MTSDVTSAWQQIHLFPVQTGPPSLFARKARWEMVVILVAQTVLTVLAILQIRSIVPALIQGLGTAIGFIALNEYMNITYVCWFGFLSFIGAVAYAITGCLSIALSVITLQVQEVVLRVLIFAGSLAGAIFGTLLFRDYEKNHKITDLAGRFFEFFGLLKGGETLPLLSPGNLSSAPGTALLTGAAGAIEKVSGWSTSAYDSVPQGVGRSAADAACAIGRSAAEAYESVPQGAGRSAADAAYAISRSAADAASDTNYGVTQQPLNGASGLISSWTAQLPTGRTHSTTA